MPFEFTQDIFKLALEVAIIFFPFKRYIRWRKPHWVDSVERHKTTILAVMVFVLLGIKISEDALSGDSGPLDQTILLFVHKHVPTSFAGFFEIVTVTGSFKFFVPLVLVISLLFVRFKKWFEAFVLASSTVCGG
jgi:hypothetical protein